MNNKDKIIAGIAYLFSKKTLTYSLMVLLSGYMIITSTVNYQVKQKIEIEKLNASKQKFIDSKALELKPLSSKLNELKTQEEQLKSKIKPIQDCISNVKSTINTFEIYNCSKLLIPKASADEENLQTALTPDKLFYTTNIQDKCYVSQTEKEHFKSNGRLAVDVACGFKSIIYAPDYNNQPMSYTIEQKAFPDTGNTLILHFEYNGAKYFWLLGHTQARKMDKAVTGQILGQMDMSGISTGYHSHIELWQGNNLDDAVKVSYSSSTRSLMNMRQNKLQSWKSGDSFYFTHYDLGDVNQNDQQPCIGASGKNLCDLEKQGIRTIALTVDVRNSLGIKFGDKVKLNGPCSGIYEVHDEMNSRYRYGNVMKGGYPIKGDIPSCEGGIHSVTKA